MFDCRIVISSGESAPSSTGELEEGYDTIYVEADAQQGSRDTWVDPTATQGNPLLVLKIQRLIASVNINSYTF